MNMTRIRLVAAALAVLTGLLPAAPVAAAASPLPEPIVAIESSSQPFSPFDARQPQRQVQAAALNIAVTESCGVAGDNVVRAVQACTLQATVTDGAGNPVSGAAVGTHDRSAVTNSTGSAALTVTYPYGATWPVVADYAGYRAIHWIYVAGPGQGVLEVLPTDRAGNPISDTTVIVKYTNGTSSWVYDSDTPQAGAVFPTGTYKVIVTARKGPGEGYIMEFLNVIVEDGKKTTQAAPGSTTHPVTVTLDLNGSPISGADAWVASTHWSSYTATRGIQTANGQAVIGVNADGNYDVAAIGGTPAVFAVQENVAISGAATVRLALTETAQVTWAPALPAGAPAPAGGYVQFSTGSSIRTYTWPVTGGTLLVRPGSYLLRTGLRLTQGKESWDYHFYGLMGGFLDPWALFPYAAGRQYTMTAGGPWSMQFEQMSTEIDQNERIWVEAVMQSRDAQLNWLNYQNSDTNTSHNGYRMAIKNAAGQELVSKPNSRSIDYQATTAGSFRAEATMFQPGPFFGAGATFSAVRGFDVTPTGAHAGLDIWNLGFDTDTVLPNGAINVYPYLILPAGSTLKTVAFETRFDPTRVSFDLAASDPGDGTFTSSSGAVMWTASATAGQEPGFPELRFVAVPGFAGEAVISVGPGTVVTDQSGTVSLARASRTVTVAANAVSMKVYTRGFGPAVAATDGITTKPGVTTDAYGPPATGFRKVAVLNLPTTMTSLVLMAPHHLAQQVPVSVPATGMTDNGEAGLAYGDIDGNGAVTIDDLNLVADWLTVPAQPMGPYDYMFDARPDGQVDVYDLVLSARNVGLQGNVSAPMGNVDVTVRTPGLVGSVPVRMTAHMGQEDQTIPMQRLFVASGEATTFRLTGLLPGYYYISIDIPDREGNSIRTFVVAGQTTAVTLDW